MRVLVLWADKSSANMGVRVLAEGMANLARAAWGEDTEISFQDFGLGESSVSFSGRSVARDVGRRHGPIKARLASFDVILDSGAGDSFADIYGLKRLAIINYAHRMATRERVPLILGPQTIGPFNRGIGKVLGRDSLSRALATYPRDSESASYAEHFKTREVALSTDVVFALPQPAPTIERDVIVNVSGLLWSVNAHVDRDGYRSQVTRLVRDLLQKGRTVSLLAHVIDNAGADNDVPAIHEVASAVGGNVETIVPDSLASARSAIASSKLVIGSRMHACLNALSTGVPAIPWAYSRKFAPLLSDLGWEEAIDLRTHPSPAQATLRLIDADQHLLAERARAVSAAARERLQTTIHSLQSTLPHPDGSRHVVARGEFQ